MLVGTPRHFEICEGGSSLAQHAKAETMLWE
jgi:hypothetical protein